MQKLHLALNERDIKSTANAIQISPFDTSNIFHPVKVNISSKVETKKSFDFFVF